MEVMESPSAGIYLDCNATTPVHPEVAEAVMPFLHGEYGNPSAPYAAGRAARERIEAARAQTARLIGAAPDEIIFTSGGTEAINLAIQGACAAQGKSPPAARQPPHHHQRRRASGRAGDLPMARAARMRTDGRPGGRRGPRGCARRGGGDPAGRDRSSRSCTPTTRRARSSRCGRSAASADPLAGNGFERRNPLPRGRRPGGGKNPAWT